MRLIILHQTNFEAIKINSIVNIPKNHILFIIDWQKKQKKR